MTDSGILIAVAYAAFSLAGIGIALFVAANARRRRAATDAGADTESLERHEKTWMWIVLGILGALLLASIWFTPYGESAGAGGQRMDVVARQFAWELEPNRARAGVPVEFRLRAVDVNHAFGVYDPDGKLVFQVQVQPGFEQRAVETFEQPGTYEILCLEYCGVLHHGMVGSFTVTR
jgi:cytochrome c oxidase subunit II